MKVLILGAGGMLGHKLYMRLKPKFETWAAVRADFKQYERFGIFDSSRFVGGVNLEHDEAVSEVLDKVMPDVILNCVGVTTRKTISTSALIRMNSLLPHQLWDWAKGRGKRVIHFSTDCVFNGERGNYSESDVPDARDLYGLSKTLGELHEAPGLTIRSSIIGREIFHHTELVEWLVSQKGGSAKGFARVFYSGVTTNYMAYLVERILMHREPIYGLYHLASPRISKFELLEKINIALGLGVRLERDDSKASDKSLVGNRLLEILKNAEKPEWHQMIQVLAEEDQLYREWKLGRT